MSANLNEKFRQYSFILYFICIVLLLLPTWRIKLMIAEGNMHLKIVCFCHVFLVSRNIKKTLVKVSLELFVVVDGRVAPGTVEDRYSRK